MNALFTSRRISTDGQSIISRWFDPAGTALCYCLEPGAARLPNPAITAGVYGLRLRTIGEKHHDYKAHYDRRFGPGWHLGMVEIFGVPSRTCIEFHCGNTIADTKGCNVAGESVLAPPGNGSGHYEVVRSRSAYERVYPVLRNAILNGGATLNIQPIGKLIA